MNKLRLAACRPVLAPALVGAVLGSIALGSATGCTSSRGVPGGARLVMALPTPVEEATVLGAPLRLSLMAERVCADAACTGRGYRLGVVNASGRDVYLAYAPVQLFVAGRTFRWLEDVRDETTLPPAVGTFVRVPLSEDVMRLLVAAPTATLALGNTRFVLSGAQLRRLATLVPPG